MTTGADPAAAAPPAEAVIAAIRASWSEATTADPSRWTPERPAIGQCDASSFVAWTYLGGDLVLSKVMVDDEQREHHYSNRINGRDIDLTEDQFDGHEQLIEVSVVSHDELEQRGGEMRSELAGRIALLRTAVEGLLAAP